MNWKEFNRFAATITKEPDMRQTKSYFSILLCRRPKSRKLNIMHVLLTMHNKKGAYLVSHCNIMVKQ